MLLFYIAVVFKNWKFGPVLFTSCEMMYCIGMCFTFLFTRLADAFIQSVCAIPGIYSDYCEYFLCIRLHILLVLCPVINSYITKTYFSVSQGNKHKQISDRLRDAKSKGQVQRVELDLIHQKRESRIVDINSLQLQFEVWILLYFCVAWIYILSYVIYI